MTQYYSDPRRESSPHALPDIEVFYVSGGRDRHGVEGDGSPREAGFYWWPCFPGCLPDGDPIGPFETEAEALADAREQAEYFGDVDSEDCE